MAIGMRVRIQERDPVDQPHLTCWGPWHLNGSLNFQSADERRQAASIIWATPTSSLPPCLRPAPWLLLDAEIKYVNVPALEATLAHATMLSKRGINGSTGLRQRINSAWTRVRL